MGDGEERNWANGSGFSSGFLFGHEIRIFMFPFLLGGEILFSVSDLELSLKNTGERGEALFQVRLMKLSRLEPAPL